MTCLSIYLPMNYAALADVSELSETEERVSKAQVSLTSVLSPESRQLAEELGMMPHLERLKSLSEHSKHKNGEPLSIESLTLRLELTETVLTTMLQCQEVTNEIDAELSDAHDATAVLSAKTSKATRINSIANVATNGLISGVGTILQIPEQLSEQPGEILESGGTLATTVLGVLALKQTGGKLSSAIRPNMLARVFGRPNDMYSEYPDVVWTYLNSPIPGASDRTTRRNLLIRAWETLGRIPPHDSAKGRQYIRMVTGTSEQKNTITADALDARSSMLDDLRSSIGQMSRDLLNLMLLIRAL